MSTQTYLYSQNDRPPVLATITLGVQHAILALVFLVYPLAVAQELNLNPSATLDFLTSCVLAIGIATGLHFFRSPVGSSSLAVEIPTPIFLPTAILAGSAGGLAAITAVAFLSGVTEILFSKLLRYVRALFPAEVCGIAVLMLGISIIRPGMLDALGVDSPSHPMQTDALAVSLATLIAMVFMSIFGSRRIKLLALAGGVLVGFLLSVHLGMIGYSELSTVMSAPLLALPHVSLTAPRIDWSIVPLAVVMALVLSVDNIGMLVSIQKQNDSEWHKIDLQQTAGGIQVSGIGDLIAGFFGGMPTGISSANVGLSHATGAVSRVISLATGMILIAAAFAPKIIVALSLVPRPVVGAIMVYASVYMVVSGMGLILNRILNERRIFVIGFSIVLGLSSALVPGIYHDAPNTLRPILESPLAISTLVAMALTQLFRIGAAIRKTLDVELSDSLNESLQEMEVNQSLRSGLEKIASEVGAEKAFVNRAIDVTSEIVAAMRIAGCVDGAVRFIARFEDTRLEIVLRYDGRSIPLASQAEGSSGSTTLRGYPLQHIARMARNVDRFIPSSHGDQQTLLLVYQP